MQALDPNQVSLPPTIAASAAAASSAAPSTMYGGSGRAPFRGPHHRRSQSEFAFRIIADDFDLAVDLFAAAPATSLEEIGSEDDLFSTYMNVDKIGSKPDDSHSGDKMDCAVGSGGQTPKGADAARPVRPRHRHSNSVDGSMMFSSKAGESVFGEVIEAKKAMAADKLAELAAIDPKRAKRIIANRQSAARSKERKAHYISELEQKVQTLQTEATTLSAQLTLFQHDTSGLTTENTELKLRLQAMEQQAQLRDAFNKALKQEVERLKLATGELFGPGDAFNMGMHQMSFNPSFFSLPLQPAHHIQASQFQPSQPNLPCQQLLTTSQAFSEMMQHESLGRLQGLDISRGSHLVKSEGPSLSASENGSTL